MTALLVAILTVEVALPVLVFFLRDRVTFFPSREFRAAAGLPLVGPGVEARVVAVVRPDGRRLEAYDARPAGAKGDGPVVLFLHGNAGSLAGRAPVLGEFVRGTGARTLMLDYSGFEIGRAHV